MSERYWITGAQLGLLVCMDMKVERYKLMDEISDKQFIVNCETEKEKEQFELDMDDYYARHPCED